MGLLRLLPASHGECRRSPRWSVFGAIVVACAGVMGLTAGPSFAAVSSERVLRFPFANIRAIAVDQAGDVFATNGYVIDELAVGSRKPVRLFVGPLFGPGAGIHGLAVDTHGDVFFTVGGSWLTGLGYPASSSVEEVPAGSKKAIPTAVGGGWEYWGVAVDGAGDMFATDWGEGLVKEYSASTNSVVTLPFPQIPGPTQVQDADAYFYLPARCPYGVTVDSAGDVFVAGYGEVDELVAGSASAVALPFPGVPGNLDPNGIAVDGAGDVYATSTPNNAVYELPAGSTSAVQLSFPGLSSPWSLAIDGAGDVFAAGETGGEVYELPA